MQRFLAAGLVVVGVCIPAMVRAQGQTDRLTVPFSDPSKPGLLNVSLMAGSVSIRGADRREDGGGALHHLRCLSCDCVVSSARVPTVVHVQFTTMEVNVVNG